MNPQQHRCENHKSHILQHIQASQNYAYIFLGSILLQKGHLKICKPFVGQTVVVELWR